MGRYLSNLGGSGGGIGLNGLGKISADDLFESFGMGCKKVFNRHKIFPPSFFTLYIFFNLIFLDCDKDLGFFMSLSITPHLLQCNTALQCRNIITYI